MTSLIRSIGIAGGLLVLAGVQNASAQITANEVHSRLVPFTVGTPQCRRAAHDGQMTTTDILNERCARLCSSTAETYKPVSVPDRRGVPAHGDGYG